MADRHPAVPYGARAWAEIDLAAAAANVRLLRSRLRGGTRVMAVLKADAYGHGAAVAARRLMAEGVEMIGVGDSSEAIELREAGVVAPILVLGAIVPGEVEKVVAYGVAAYIHSRSRLELLAQAAAAQAVFANIVLLALICLAIVDQYPHPDEPAFLAFVALTVLTPILSALVLLRSRNGRAGEAR